MSGLYFEAVEKRLSYLRWLHSQPANPWSYTPAHVAGMYRAALSQGDTYFMDKHFCELVDHARQTVPHDLVFEKEWLQSPAGFIWLETPFLCPPLDRKSLPTDLRDDLNIDQMKIQAVGWSLVPPGTMIRRIAGEKLFPSPPGLMQFVCFLDYQTSDVVQPGFGAWSYYALFPGDRLRGTANRIRESVEA